MVQFTLMRVHPQLRHYSIMWYETEKADPNSETVPTPVYKGGFLDYIASCGEDPEMRTASASVDGMEMWLWSDFINTLEDLGIPLTSLEVSHTPQYLIVTVI